MITTEDKVAIKEAVLDALLEYDRRKDQDSWKRHLKLHGETPLKDLISSHKTPKTEVDEKQPH